MRPSHVLFLCSVLAVGAAAGDASAKLAKAGDATVSFTATGPGGLKIVGTTGDLVVADDGQTVSITVPLRSLDTKIELRNKHMREKYLEVDKYPTAVLVVPRSELRMPQNGDVSAEAGGTMKIHGNERPVRFKYTAKRAGAQMSVSGNVRLNIKDFGIEEPSFMGASVKPVVDVAAGFSVSDT
jgi:polyisoprenoid-binding protein YceI